MGEVAGAKGTPGGVVKKFLGELNYGDDAAANLQLAEGRRIRRWEILFGSLLVTQVKRISYCLRFPLFRTRKEQRLLGGYHAAVSQTLDPQHRTSV
jgi:hypothetical protein